MIQQIIVRVLKLTPRLIPLYNVKGACESGGVTALLCL